MFYKILVLIFVYLTMVGAGAIQLISAGSGDVATPKKHRWSGGRHARKAPVRLWKNQSSKPA